MVRTLVKYRKLTAHIVLDAIRAPESTRVGKSAAFTCSASDGSNIAFSWTKDGILLRESPRIQIFNAKKTSVLNVEDVESSDGGDYTCVATNNISEDRAKAHLIVEGDEAQNIGRLRYA